MRKLTVNALGEIVDRDAQARDPKTFGLLRPEQLTPAERRFVKAVYERQSCNNGRFNVWGCIQNNGRPLIRLDTEFKARVKAVNWWRAFRQRMRRIGLQVEVLDAVQREDDGVYRQVACWLDISKCSAAEARQERRRIAEGTEKFWQTHGIGVV